MPDAVRIAWSSTHQEFLITDSYYFSILAKESQKQGLIIEEVSEFPDLFSYDVIVFNYPEQPFTEEEINQIKRAVTEEHKRVIFAAHFQNKDNVAYICSQVAQHFGMRAYPGEVMDRENCLMDDPYMVVTSNVLAYNEGVQKVVFPYAAPIEVYGPARIILRGMPTTRTKEGQAFPVLMAEKVLAGGGSFILSGSCVFWDNFSIGQLDNLKFILNLLKGPF